MPVVVLGVNHRTAPVEVREKLAFAAPEIPDALAALRSEAGVEEAVILSTCNRVELYLAGAAGAEDLLGNARVFLQQNRGIDGPLDDRTLYHHSDTAGLEHLFRVSAGLDSMVLGETEILGQLKQAYQLALKSGATGRLLNKAFQRAFNVAKQIRTHTNIQRGTVSVSSVSVDMAGRIFDTLKHCTVLVIGAGDTGGKAARAMVSRGAQAVRVTNRSAERAQGLAAELGGEAVPFERWPEELERVDIVICCTSAPHYVLEAPALASRLKARQGQPLLLLDLAVPRDIDPAVNGLEGVYLCNVDDLQCIANEAMQQRQAEIERCNALVRERAAEPLLRRPPPDRTSRSQTAPAGDPALQR